MIAELDFDDSYRLAVYFDLTPAEKDGIRQGEDHASSILLKMMEKREYIMPRRMIDFYNALIDIHQNKAASLVLKYIQIQCKPPPKKRAVTPVPSPVRNRVTTSRQAPSANTMSMLS